MKNVHKEVQDAKLKKGKIEEPSSPLSVTNSSNKKKIIIMFSTYHSHNSWSVTISGSETAKPISVLYYSNK
jgi:hypothetical protein